MPSHFKPALVIFSAFPHLEGSQVRFRRLLAALLQQLSANVVNVKIPRRISRASFCSIARRLSSIAPLSRVSNTNTVHRPIWWAYGGALSAPLSSFLRLHHLRLSVPLTCTNHVGIVLFNPQFFGLSLGVEYMILQLESRGTRAGSRPEVRHVQCRR